MKNYSLIPSRARHFAGALAALALSSGLILTPAHAAAVSASEAAIIKADLSKEEALLSTLRQDIAKDLSNKSGSGFTARDQGGAPVPEPSAWILMGTLVVGAGFLAARDRKTARA